MKTLETICDKDSHEDQKTLLLAKIVDDRFNSMLNRQEELYSQFTDTLTKIINNVVDITTKIADLTIDMSSMKKERNECPVYKNKDAARSTMLLLRHPKIVFLIIGIIIADITYGGPELRALVAAWFKSYFKI